MNNRIEHVNAGYDPITNWRSHDLEGARSEALSGGVDATRAALLGLTAGKEHSADIQNLAAEETAYRQALFEAQAAIKTYIAEIMATEQELSVAQIQGLQTAQMYADNPEMIDNSLITGADVMDGITIGGAALLFVGEAIWRKTEKMSPESKRIIFALLVLAFGGIACLSNIPSVINTAVAQGATPVFAQGLSPTPTRTQIPTRQPTKEPTASKTPTAETSPIPSKTPEALKIPDDVMKLFIKYGIDKQFENGEEMSNVYCLAKIDTIRNVNFTVGDLQILRVADCWYLDSNDQLKIITLPVAMYNKVLNKWMIWGMGIQNGNPTSAFIDGTLESAVKFWDGGNTGFAKANFTIGDFSNQAPDYVSFLESAAKTQKKPSDKFATGGNPDEFPDKTNAKNFVAASNVTFSVTK